MAKKSEEHRRDSRDYKLAEHYLFDLGCSIAETAEILGMDADFVSWVYVEESRYRF